MGGEHRLTERLVVEPEDDIRIPPVVQPRSSSQHDLSFRCDGAAKSACVQRSGVVRAGAGAEPTYETQCIPAFFAVSWRGPKFCGCGLGAPKEKSARSVGGSVRMTAISMVPRLSTSGSTPESSSVRALSRP